MLGLLWLIPMLPLAGFLVLAIVGAAVPRKAASVIAIGPTAVSCGIALLIAAFFVHSPPAGEAYSQSLGTWLNVQGLNVSFGFYLDSLSLVMATVVTFVGLLILIYSVEFMRKDEGYSRFFAYMNLFIASMLILLLADNLLLMYLGWEGVGLCSYLLIGFWYREPENCRAAVKAFVVTRLGDTLLVIGLFMLVWKYHTLGIQTIMGQISQLPEGTGFCTLVALFLLSGAVGKSAQLPLQTWLPDAMAGPTPVSALIHAATMVTAGVYLIARTHVLFALAPVVMHVVAVIGAATLLLAGFSALAQEDIKRILAYSTISQIGYMFLALGAGAWAAAIYHFVTHALFKSSLFLSAGVLIMKLNGEHNIFKMGGLRKAFPGTFRAFIAASLTLAAIPPLTLTFNSKDLILNTVWASSEASQGLWFCGVFGAFLTAAYSFRMLYVVFGGEMRTRPTGKPTAIMFIPLFILAFLAAISGLPELISNVFGIKTFYQFLQSSLPEPVVNVSLPAHVFLMQFFYASESVAAIGLTYVLYRYGRNVLNATTNTFLGSVFAGFVFAGFGFDWIYRWIIVRPYIWTTRINKNDVMDWITKANVHLFRGSNFVLSELQNGNLRWYVGGIGIGAMILLGLVILL
jgi:NADH-quinone oxidoreductase subunit L